MKLTQYCPKAESFSIMSGRKSFEKLSWSHCLMSHWLVLDHTHSQNDHYYLRLRKLQSLGWEGRGSSYLSTKIRILSAIKYESEDKFGAGNE